MNTTVPPPLMEAYPVSDSDHREHFALLGASAVCFAVACAVPALRFHDLNGLEQNWVGGTIVLLGWMGALAGQFAWFANLFLFGSWISLCFRWRPGAVVLAALALVVASHSFALFGQVMPADEGGTNKLLLIRLMPGFYFWIASIVLAVTSGVVCRSRK